jgi:hypothetical protein
LTTLLVLHSTMEAEMGVLGKLKIVALAPKVKASAEQDRRAKLIGQLDEQKKKIEGVLAGTPYQRTKQVWIDGDDGSRTRVERPVRARQWWLVGANGVVQFGLRYGAVPLELQPGKTAIEVAKLADLPAVIATLIEAVAGGELDAAMAQRARLRNGTEAK